MSYGRDPDAHTRGVGAIASLDGNRARGLAARRAAQRTATRDRMMSQHTMGRNGGMRQGLGVFSATGTSFQSPRQPTISSGPTIEGGSLSSPTYGIQTVRTPTLIPTYPTTTTSPPLYGSINPLSPTRTTTPQIVSAPLAPLTPPITPTQVASGFVRGLPTGVTTQPTSTPVYPSPTGFTGTFGIPTTPPITTPPPTPTTVIRTPTGYVSPFPTTTTTPPLVPTLNPIRPPVTLPPQIISAPLAPLTPPSPTTGTSSGSGSSAGLQIITGGSPGAGVVPQPGSSYTPTPTDTMTLPDVPDGAAPAFLDTTTGKVVLVAAGIGALYLLLRKKGAR